MQSLNESLLSLSPRLEKRDIDFLKDHINFFYNHKFYHPVVMTSQFLTDLIGGNLTPEKMIEHLKTLKASCSNKGHESICRIIQIFLASVDLTTLKKQRKFAELQKIMEPYFDKNHFDERIIKPFLLTYNITSVLSFLRHFSFSQAEKDQIENQYLVANAKDIYLVTSGFLNHSILSKDTILHVLKTYTFTGNNLFNFLKTNDVDIIEATEELYRKNKEYMYHYKMIDINTQLFFNKEFSEEDACKFLGHYLNSRDIDMERISQTFSSDEILCIGYEHIYINDKFFNIFHTALTTASAHAVLELAVKLKTIQVSNFTASKSVTHPKIFNALRERLTFYLGIDPDVFIKNHKLESSMLGVVNKKSDIIQKMWNSISEGKQEMVLL